MEKTGRAWTPGWDLQGDGEWEGGRETAVSWTMVGVHWGDGAWSLGCWQEEVRAPDGKVMGRRVGAGIGGSGGRMSHGNMRDMERQKDSRTWSVSGVPEFSL